MLILLSFCILGKFYMILMTDLEADIRNEKIISCNNQSKEMYQIY